MSARIHRPVGRFPVYQRRLLSSNQSLNQIPIASHKLPLPPLSVMPTKTLLRSLMMNYILSSPHLVRFIIPIMDRISHSKSWFLNPDKNPILHLAVRKLFYDHFCAGENEREVKSTIKAMKNMGFKGVILGYARETLADKNANSETLASNSRGDLNERVIEEWRDGTLETLSMLEEGDFLAVK
jgi:proline dehydrogenase